MMTINEEGKALVEQKGFNKEEALKEFMGLCAFLSKR